MLLGNAPKISLLYAPIMLRAVPFCPKHANTVEFSIRVFYYINCDRILRNHPYGHARIFEFTTILLTSQKNISTLFLLIQSIFTVLKT